MEGRPGKFPENSTDLKNANDPETVRGDISILDTGGKPELKGDIFINSQIYLR